MTTDNQIAKPSVGAVFYRCALQVNPHDYAQSFRGQASATNAADYARTVVDKAVELGISVLAVTDHNDVSSVPAFREAAKSRGVHVFPGFELSSRSYPITCLRSRSVQLKW
ncbi:MAG TPA: PHP domain-containing protein, partial [Polyangiaceae bacterium]|nr:PHP domain-containing protein [Thermoanaerobaculia bacterium]HQP37595.1 PHP domain-containing protein [Polyangiaceae bacterium]HQN10192.1 PHP domain-containing protein [Thermoanaerobaculia bacterium]HRR14165.1 PHP domain-containing protein [Thermoanaerobaculia bacterium]HRS36386.1 PHP domain-containing protein [Thermoanaerobaculia bacterium]